MGNKTCKALIVGSHRYVDRLSIRNHEGHDLRPALSEAGFKEEEKVVIITQEEYDYLLLQEAQGPSA